MVVYSLLPLVDEVHESISGVLRGLDGLWHSLDEVDEVTP